MTAVEQYSNMQNPVVMPEHKPNYSEAVPLLIAFAPNWPIWHILFRIAGTALMISAAAMWIMPQAQLSPDLMLFKLAISVVFFLCGLALLMVHHSDNRPDALFDPLRKEVRVMQKNNRGRLSQIMCRPYSSLGSARFRSNAVELFDID
ncbi:MAG: hypothetical protein D6773_16010, partial [Alphaproteobacteria bacterium]